MYSLLSSWTMTHSTSPASSSSSSSSSSSVPRLPSPRSVWTHVVIAIFIVLVYTSSASEACFIRDCPIGGKRSMGQTTIARRQCTPCGLRDAGQCVGPAICCSPSFGCHMGTRETEVCQKENQSVEPCYVTGEACGSHNDGNCVANGICCDSDSCAYNERCREIADESVGTNKDRNQILELITKILRNKSFN